MWFRTLGILLVFAEVICNAAATTAFGCKNSLITDEWREKVLKFHNDYRTRVSEGQQVCLGNKVMPYSKNMNRLNWDCNIEHNAWLYSCDNSYKTPDKYAILSASIKMPNKNCDIAQVTTDKLREWWDEAKTKDLSTPPVTMQAGIEHFGQMVNAKVTGFACTYNKCGSDGKLVCMYNKMLEDGDNLYNGSKNKADACICPVAGTTCINKLCEKEYTPSTATYPRPKCSASKMTYDMEQIALDTHNYYRRLVATGWAEDKDGYAKWASKMPALATDCTIATASKTLAHDCTLTSYTATPGYSLNYHKESHTVSEEDTLRKGIKAWFEQIANVDIDDSATYTSDIEQNAPKFAKMVFEGATKLGCSTKQCPAQGFTVAICQYNGIPSVSDALYNVGKTCSKCTTCEPLGGLCA